MTLSPPEAAVGSLHPDVDPFGLAEDLTDRERAAVLRLRTYLETEVADRIDECWDTATLPEGLREGFASLDTIAPDGIEPSQVYRGFQAFELASFDPSIATYYTAQAGLFRTVCRLGCSEEQGRDWFGPVDDFSTTGVFCLTEPDHGSDIAGGLATTATRDGDTWTITGAKRWIGGAGEADVLAVFARDTADGKVKGFLIDRENPGIGLRKIERKASLRIMPNFDIDLDHVQVDEGRRLGNVNGFADVARMLARMRFSVAWMAAGIQAGATRAALDYVKSREQFGRPLGGFQLVQEKLATMHANTVASLSFVHDLSRTQDRGEFRNEDSAMAKMWVCRRMRETVALAREVAGGNGITLDARVARFHADAEAVYSYEGTDDINALILGRHLTGVSAFT